MIDSLSAQVRTIIELASTEARRLQHEYIGTEHLLLGLIAEGSGIAATLLRSRGLDYAHLHHEVEQLVQTGPVPVTSNELPLTPRAKQALQFAEDDARIVGQPQIETEHLLVGLLREPDGVAGVILRKCGMDLKEVAAEVFKIRLLQMKIVERAVRPVLANIVRKRRMRDEMLAHLSAIYDEELTRSGDPNAAVKAASERFGSPAELTAELQATVPKHEQWEMGLDRLFGWRAPETALRWMLRLSTHLLLVMTAACLLVAMLVFREFGWSENIFLVVRPIAAMTIVMPLSFLVSGVSYYQMRNSLVGVFGMRKSTGRALLWAALLAIATNAAGVGFLWMAYGGLPNNSSDFFWILGVFGMMWAAFAFLYARANGPQEIRDTAWALLDLDDQPLAA